MSIGRDGLCPRGFQQARWGVWRNVPRVKLWQAVALSCDIDPDDMRRQRGLYWSSGYADPAIYDERITVAAAQCRAGRLPCAPLPALVTPETHDFVPDDEHRREVDLAAFAAWASKIEPRWAMPEAMQELAAQLAAGDKPTGDLEWDGQSPEWDELAAAVKLGAALLPPGDDAVRAAFHGLSVGQLQEHRATLGREPRSEELLSWAARLRPRAQWRPRKLTEIVAPIEDTRSDNPANLARIWTLPNGDEMTSVELGRLLHREWKAGALGVEHNRAEAPSAGPAATQAAARGVSAQAQPAGLDDVEAKEIARQIPDGAHPLVREIAALEELESVGREHLKVSRPTVSKYLPLLLRLGIASERPGQRLNNIMRGPMAVRVVAVLK